MHVHCHIHTIKLAAKSHMKNNHVSFTIINFKTTYPSTHHTLADVLPEHHKDLRLLVWCCTDHGEGKAVHDGACTGRPGGFL